MYNKKKRKEKASVLYTNPPLQRLLPLCFFWLNTFSILNYDGCLLQLCEDSSRRHSILDSISDCKWSPKAPAWYYVLYVASARRLHFSQLTILSDSKWNWVVFVIRRWRCVFRLLVKVGLVRLIRPLFFVFFFFFFFFYQNDRTKKWALGIAAAATVSCGLCVSDHLFTRLLLHLNLKTVFPPCSCSVLVPLLAVVNHRIAYACFTVIVFFFVLVFTVFFSCCISKEEEEKEEEKLNNQPSLCIFSLYATSWAELCCAKEREEGDARRKRSETRKQVSRQ